MAWIAVGYPGWPQPTTSWDWWPFVGIAVGFLLLRSATGSRLRLWMIAAAIAAGPLFSATVHRWGAAPCVSVAAFSWAALAIRRRRGPTARRAGTV